MSTRSFDWIGHHARTRPDRIAQVDLATDRTFTWVEMNDRTTRLAHVLANEIGICAGDRVAVLANNNTNFFEVQFACWKLGAIFVPLNWRLAIPELEFIVGDCAPKAIFFDDDFAEAAEQLSTTCNIGHRINWETESSGDVADYEEALASASTDIELHDSTHDTVLTIMYTSGTTGRPKGAQITQGMTFWNAVNCVEFYGLTSEMVNLAFLPLFHTGGLNVFANPGFHFGGTTYVMRTFEPTEAIRLLTDRDIAISHFIGVPANFLFMSQTVEFASADFGNIEAACVGGSPTPVPLIETWDTKGLPLQQAYGMTETSPLVLALKPEDCSVKVGSAGLPAMHCEVRVVNENGDDAAVGETGELWVRGPNVTPGYWNRPDANESSFEDGFLKTGDATRVDDDGFFYVVDRWKDMYISGGENVYPAEVESVIYEVEGVGEVAVIGIPDDKWVEVGRALVVKKDDAGSLDEATIINHCRASLARFKVPQSVLFIDEIPHNATGKVLKRELREHYGV